MWLNNEIFKLTPSDFPGMPPELSEESRLWWKEQRRRCIEGYWAAGRWMPGPLYFYINFWHILVNVDKWGKVKRKSRPELWDVFWEASYGLMTAYGLTGFDTQKEVLEFKTYVSQETSLSAIRKRTSEMPQAKDFLWNTTKDLGKPLFLFEAKNFPWMGCRGHGKELADYEVVITENGEVPIGKVKIGTKIYGRDGKLTTVTEVFPQGEKDIYRFHFIDGRYVDCGLEHQWLLYNQHKRSKVYTTKELLHKNLSHKHPKSGSTYYYKLPDIQPVEFSYKEQPIHPYILGALLGDGAITTSTPKIACNDIEILNRFKELLPEYNIVYDSSTVNNYTITEKNKFRTKSLEDDRKYGANDLARSIKKLQLNVGCKDKFIPSCYIFGSIEQRMELVRGLMDTDGSVTESGHCEFSNSNLTLLSEVAYVLRSLGIYCKIDVSNREGQYHILPHGALHERGICYRLYIRTDKPIFYLPRKLNRLKKRVRSNKVSLVKIEKINRFTATCIMVDNKDHLFLTKDFIPTHNSYFVAGAIIGHDWLFDGLTEYKPANEVTETMEIVVGAGDAKYSTDLLTKVKYGLDNLPGAISIGTEKFRSPFSKLYSGTFALNTDTQAYYKKNVGGNWETFGTGSVIKHKSYKDNPFAAAGTRPGRLILEEFGLFDDGLEALHNGEDCMKNGEYKFGTAIMTGTGGDMEKGTISASKVFRNPEDYKCVSYEDTIEHKGRIGFFVSTIKGTSQYKNKDGITNYELGEKEDDAIREEIRKGKNASVALDARKQNQPRNVSEMFLSKRGNIFPRAELQNHLGEIEGNDKYISSEDVGELIYKEDGRLCWSHLPSDRAIRIFPHDIAKDDCRGAIQIWHHPLRNDEGKVPDHLYIAGTDPYDHDSSGTPSLGSTIIYLKIYNGLQIQELPVAEYTGRHEKGSDAYYEGVRKLLIYYNARCMFENNLIGMYKYFERKNCTNMLMEVPEYAKEVTGSQPNRPKGMHFGNPQIVHGELLIKNWLEEEISPGVLQLTKLRSVSLIRELISYDREGNFDRVRALMAVLYAREETFRYAPDIAEKVKTLSEDPFWNRNFNNPAFIKRRKSYTSQNFNGPAIEI